MVGCWFAFVVRCVFFVDVWRYCVLALLFAVVGCCCLVVGYYFLFVVRCLVLRVCFIASCLLIGVCVAFCVLFVVCELVFVGCCLSVSGRLCVLLCGCLCVGCALFDARCCCLLFWLLIVC